jgi:adenosine deaminase CECR1
MLMTLQFVSINFNSFSSMLRVCVIRQKGSTDYVVSLTKYKDLWQLGGIENGDMPEYLFSRKKPASVNGVEWRLVSEIRKEIGDAVYDKKVRKYFTLIVDNPMVKYNDINSVWNTFMDIFKVFGSLVTYTETWKDYYRQSLQEMYDDNVQYLEFRGVLPEVLNHSLIVC